MKALASANLAVRFACELCALASLGAWGYISFPPPWSYLLATAAPLAAAALWGSFIAPKAKRRAPDPLRLLLELAVFGAASGSLVAVGRPGLAVTLAIAAVGSALLARRWSEPAEHS